MTSAILNITVDCADAGAVARFWSAVTGWALHEEGTWDGRDEYSAGPAAPGGVRLYFVTVPEPKAVKNRIHLDLLPPPGQEREEVARLIGLGASVAGDQPAGAGWLIMADPEGNEFCVEGAAGYGAGAGH